jgi:SM-20-related protein
MNPMLDATRIAAAMHGDGWWVDGAALDRSLCSALWADLHALDTATVLTSAGIGRAATYQRDPNVRSDRIAWLTPTTPAQRTFLSGLESLRVALNRSLYLGLQSTEAHFARYDAGARYQRHLDSFAGGGSRIVSLVAYLNPGWCSADGGELVLYTPDAAREVIRILPSAGTVVAFLSEEFPHEVRQTTRDRASIAAWLRRAPR